jgi:hypothetical protein
MCQNTLTTIHAATHTHRFVVPLLPRGVTGNLDDLALHSVGVLEVRGRGRVCRTLCPVL